MCVFFFLTVSLGDGANKDEESCGLVIYSWIPERYFAHLHAKHRGRKQVYEYLISLAKEEISGRLLMKAHFQV